MRKYANVQQWQLQQVHTTAGTTTTLGLKYCGGSRFLKSLFKIKMTATTRHGCNTQAGEWYDLLLYPAFNMEYFVIAFCGELLLHQMMTFFCQTLLVLLLSWVIYTAVTCILEINTTANSENLKLLLLSFGFLYKYIELRL